MVNYKASPLLSDEMILESAKNPDDVVMYKNVYNLHYYEPNNKSLVLALGTTSTLLSHGDYYKMTYDATHHMKDITFLYRTYFSAFQLPKPTGKPENKKFYLQSKITLRERPSGVWYFEIDFITNTNECDFKIIQEFNTINNLASKFNIVDWTPHNSIYENKECRVTGNQWYDYTLDIYAMAIIKEYVSACEEGETGNYVWSGTQWNLVMRVLIEFGVGLIFRIPVHYLDQTNEHEWWEINFGAGMGNFFVSKIVDGSPGVTTIENYAEFSFTYTNGKVDYDRLYNLFVDNKEFLYNVNMDVRNWACDVNCWRCNRDFFWISSYIDGKLLNQCLTCRDTFKRDYFPMCQCMQFGYENNI
jgi:hypothetical protein